MMKCKCTYCNITDETELDLHHTVPRYTFPEDYENGKKYDLFLGESNRVYLCRKHHKILHQMLEKLLFNNRQLTDLELQKKINQYSTWFYNNWRW